MAEPIGSDPGWFIFGSIVGVPCCIAAAYFGWKRWKYKASERWPLVPANYEGAHIGISSMSEQSTYYILLNFSYEVAGET
jgi:hypothetical protein